MRGPSVLRPFGFAHILSCASGPFIQRYLDTKGLLAAWREGLLAQKVLQGRTRGYRFHPQLIRFRAHKDPVEAIAAYLRFVYKEALARGYNFDVTKIAGSTKASRSTLHSRPTAPRVETFAGEAES